VGISGNVSGNFNGAIDSLVANPVSPFQANGFGYNYDNVYFPSAAPQLSFNGVLFTTTGGEQWNLWGTSPTGYSLHSYAGTGGQEVQGTITSAVPEPESYAMMLAGLGLMASIARRRKSKSV
jgi:hypothetical protein